MSNIFSNLIENISYLRLKALRVTHLPALNNSILNNHFHASIAHSKYYLSNLVLPKTVAIHKLLKEMSPKGIHQETSSGVVPRKEIFSRNTSKKLLMITHLTFRHVKRVTIKFISMFSAQHLILS